MAEKKKGNRFANLARKARGEEEGEAAEQEAEAVNITPTESLSLFCHSPESGNSK